MITTILYNIIIMPLEILVCIIYEIVRNLFHNVGISIIAVSLILQTILLPFYKKADYLQLQEQKKQKDMEKWKRHIRKTFTGDERMLMLSTYYRQQNYKVYQSLNGSLSLLLQVPFFLAAYNFLSSLPALNDASFLGINNLSLPDQLLQIGNVSVNVLPIAMTLINIVSGIVYSKDKSLQNKLQIYLLALIFLFILYNSPSGLVLYWLMNNMYSLCKNIIMKYAEFFKNLLAKFRFHSFSQKKNKVINEKNTIGYYLNKIKIRKHDYIIIATYFVLLWGCLIPLNTLNSSPLEFLNEYYGPMRIWIYTFFVYVGVFILWGNILFCSLTEKNKKTALLILYIFAFLTLSNFLFFSKNANELSPLLISLTTYNTKKLILNNESYMVIILFIGILFCNFQEKITKLVQIIAVCLIIMSTIYSINIIQKTQEVDDSSISSMQAVTPILPLSKNGSNVVIIMLDRAISRYIPYIFEEKPELKDSFQGFTYYPNTLSFGAHTNFCTPSLFGGYEYTPTEMNARSTEKLVDKHNEALRLLPNIFNKQHYNVTVCDPPYAGYSWIPNLSIYDHDSNVSTYITKGRYVSTLNFYDEVFEIDYLKKQQHNFIYYSLFKSLSLTSQYILGANNNALLLNADSFDSDFLKSYSVLYNLQNLTTIQDDGNNLILFQNSTTHEPTLLKLPDYNVDLYSPQDFSSTSLLQPQVVVNGEELNLSSYDMLSHYHVNMASMIEIADWLDYLKEMEVYDNTRIILVSDHGSNLMQFDDMVYSEDIDVQAYNSLLMVKDFNSNEFTVSDEFMTIADVPTLAVNSIIENPVNPFTGNEINNTAKFDHPQIITTSKNFEVTDTNQFDTSDGKWFSVEKNIFDSSNWNEITD